MHACACVAVDMALLKYLLMEGPVLNCDALSKKETEQVNERMRGALVLGEQAKVGKKRRAARTSATPLMKSEDREICS